MFAIAKKEWLQFFGSLNGYISICIYLVLNGLILFVFPGNNMFDFGYVTLKYFFELSPFLLLFFVPTVTMRSFSDELKFGTFELLKTLPLKTSDIVLGKFVGCVLIVLTALLPTILYMFSMQQLSSVGGLDLAATSGSYAGLFLLSLIYIALGVAVSSYTNNTVLAFIATAFLSFIFYSGFEALSKMPLFKHGWDYYAELPGISLHYKSISRGVLDIKDLVYFLGVSIIFLLITYRSIQTKK